MYRKAFSLIEIIVVIAIIGLLATLGLSSYDRVQKNARDTRRIADIEEIRKALLVYKSINKSFPGSTAALGDPDCHGWDTSFDGNFIPSLNNANYIQKMPVDPLNQGSTACDGHAAPGFNYFYYRYDPISTPTNASWLCPSRTFIVLGVGTMETTDGPHPKSSDFTCTNKNWDDTLDYYIQIYE